MAISKNNAITKGLSGVIGENLFRTMKGKTFIGKIPDMSKVLPSKNQTKKRETFAKAVEFAKAVMKDPEKMASYNVEPDHSLYHTIIADYMRNAVVEQTTLSDSLDKIKLLAGEKKLNEAQSKALIYIGEHGRLTNKIYQSINSVSKPTATRHLQEMAALNVIESNNGRGAGVVYVMATNDK